jgi:sRNA-binding protein
LKAEAKRQLKEAKARLETARQETKLMERVATAALGPLQDEMSAQYLARPIAGVTNIEDAQEMIDQLDDMSTEARGWQEWFFNKRNA